MLPGADETPMYLRGPKAEAKSEDGFSLIEAVVALSIAAVVFLALGVGAMSGLKAAATARQNQQSGDLMNQAVEQMRSVKYASLAMVPTDVSGNDGGVLTTCGTKTCLALPGGGQEPLLLATGGAVTPHSAATVLNNVSYTVRRYVTSATDTEAGASYRRVTVIVSWRALGRQHTRSTSTVVTDSRRGLPLPAFKLSPVGATTVTANPTATVVFGLKVTNNGARDTWNLTSSNDALGWTWVLDNGDGVYNATTDTGAVGDTTGDGLRDTGFIEPTKSVLVWVKRTVPATPTGPYTSNVSFTAKSFAQPDIVGVSSQALATTVQVQSGAIAPTPSPTASASTSPSPSASPTSTASASSCPTQSPLPTASGVTQTTFYLHNYAPGGTATGAASNALSLLAIGPNTVPSTSGLNDYSTNDGVTAPALTGGRILKPSTAGLAETDVFKYARFQFRLTKAQTISGQLLLSLWAVPSSASSSDGLHLKFWFVTQSKSGGSYVSSSRATATFDTASWGCTTFRKLVVGLPVNTTLANNDYTELWVENVGTTNARIAYDTSTYLSTLVVPLS